MNEVNEKDMQVNCQQHRKTMELLGLKLQLEESEMDAETRKAVQARIRELEHDLQMD
ncbi:conserved hypothetical protein [uncultured Desulfatiglans sp.]|nr:conserved hypothetical protein [uncultured Desulfatiglans sp.]